MRIQVLSVLLSIVIVAVGVEGQTPGETKESWSNYKVPRFSFRAPKRLKAVKALGLDSEIYKFEANDFEVVIDIGENAGFGAGLSEFPDYKEQLKLIDGKACRMIFHRIKSQDDEKFAYVNAVFFSRPEVGATISITIYSQNTVNPEVPIAILTSIRFRDKK